MIFEYFFYTFNFLYLFLLRTMENYVYDGQFSGNVLIVERPNCGKRFSVRS